MTNDQLSATVERVVFRNPDNGWTVLDVITADEALEKVVGFFADVHVGEELFMNGEWVEHPQFGRQFRMESYTSHLPTDTMAILRYLSSGAVRGIGPSTAAKVIDKFGEDTLRILEEEPLRLAEVRGITREKAQKLGEEFHAQSGLRELMLTFSAYGLTQSEAVRCWKRYGVSAVNRIKENPYILCNTLSVPFERADRMAGAMYGFENSPNRIEAGLLYVLRHNLGNGHTCLPAEKLVVAAAGMLEAEADIVERVLSDMLARKVVVSDTPEERPYIFLPQYYMAERYIAHHMRQMANSDSVNTADIASLIEMIETRLHIRYESQQRMALQAAVSNRVMILTGRPGTGKTTTVNGMISLLEACGEDVVLAAPTGRASKRMTELTGYEAKTLHRLLEVQWSDDDELYFARDEKNPLDADAVIVDELSMVDTILFEKLLRAVRPTARLIMVGDADQLPSVGAGNVLHSLLASGVVPTVQLTEIFRQSLQSKIVAGAHAVLEGKLPSANEKQGDFFFLKRGSFASVEETVLDLCNRRIPESYGFSCWNGIQVLCPGRRNELGTITLNEKLQQLLNPPDKNKAEVKSGNVVLRVGDKVMHNQNNYDITWTKDNGEVGTGVFNGDIGVLEKVDKRDETVTVRFDNRVALYTKEDLKCLELAYAITVHKSQGSEFDVVILTMYRHQKQLCYRNLLYTAITRAKKLLIMVGDEQTLVSMVENNRKTLRYSGLKAFLTREGFWFE